MLEIRGDHWVILEPIETERLLLRAHRQDDLDDLVAFHSDPQVTEYIPWPIRDRAVTEQALAVKLGQATAGNGEWLVLALVHREHSKVIGEVILKRESEDAAELGYVLSRNYQGSGLASEAVAAVLHEAANELGIRQVTAVIDARNSASRRLLTRLGFIAVPSREPAGDEPLSEHTEVHEYFERHLDGVPSAVQPDGRPFV